MRWVFDCRWWKLAHLRKQFIEFRHQRSDFFRIVSGEWIIAEVCSKEGSGKVSDRRDKNNENNR